MTSSSDPPTVTTTGSAVASSARSSVPTSDPDDDVEVLDLTADSFIREDREADARDRLPNSDAVGFFQATRLDGFANPLLKEINEAVMATFQDGSRASILALFDFPYRSDVLLKHFMRMRAKLVSHYRFVRGRREHGPFTPICHLTDMEKFVLSGDIPSHLPRFYLRKSDVILGEMAAATDPARQLTVKKIVSKCGFPVPVSSADRHVIRQSTFKRCGPACVAMISMDLGCRMPPECDFEPEIAQGSSLFYVEEALNDYCSDKITARLADAMPTGNDWWYVIMSVNGHFTLLSNGREPPALSRMTEGARTAPSRAPPGARDLWPLVHAHTTAGTVSSSSSSMHMGVGGLGPPVHTHTGFSPDVPMTMRDPFCGIEFQVTWAEAVTYFASNIYKATAQTLTIYPKLPTVPTSPMSSTSPMSLMTPTSPLSPMTPTSPVSASPSSHTAAVHATGPADPPSTTTAVAAVPTHTHTPALQPIVGLKHV